MLTKDIWEKYQPQIKVELAKDTRLSDLSDRSAGLIILTLYHLASLGTKATREFLHVSPDTLQKRMEELGIAIRPQINRIGVAKHTHPAETSPKRRYRHPTPAQISQAATLVNDQGLSLRDATSVTGCNHETLRRHFRKNNYPVRGRVEAIRLAAGKRSATRNHLP